MRDSKLHTIDNQSAQYHYCLMLLMMLLMLVLMLVLMMLLMLLLMLLLMMLLMLLRYCEWCRDMSGAGM